MFFCSLLEKHRGFSASEEIDEVGLIIITVVTLMYRVPPHMDLPGVKAVIIIITVVASMYRVPPHVD